MKKAIILFSGGLDSTVCLAIAKEMGFTCFALSFDYGQRHIVELESAKKITRYYDVNHHIIPLSCQNLFESSSLVGKKAVPSGNSPENFGGNVPSTYVPARNTLFLSYATALAEAENASAIFFGPNADDKDAYPDCRPAYIEAFQKLLFVSSKQAIEGNPPTLVTPLLKMSKKAIVQEGIRLNVPFELTHTCYEPTPSGKACQNCLSCNLRKQAFFQTGITDPILSSGLSNLTTNINFSS